MRRRSQCLKFLTDQQQDLKRIDKLNNLFITYMCGKDPHSTDPAENASTDARPTSAGDDADKPASGKKKRAKK